MNLHLSAARCLVSGSSRGIGRAIADVLLAEGATVGVTGRGVESLNSAYRELSDRYGAGRITAYNEDMTSPRAIADVVSRFVMEHGALTLLVANVGPAVQVGAEGEWTDVLESNLLSAVRLVDHGIPHLKKSCGCAVIVSSIAGVEALGAPLPYVAAKSALIGVVKELSRRLAPDVRVNAIVPGNVLTEGGAWERKLQANPEAVQTMLDSHVPMRRFGTPDEIARSVAFLGSPASSFTTGACLIVDGGQTRRFS